MEKEDTERREGQREEEREREEGGSAHIAAVTSPPQLDETIVAPCVVEEEWQRGP